MNGRRAKLCSERFFSFSEFVCIGWLLLCGAGNLTSRVFASGKTQALTWDGLGRLVGVVQFDPPAGGFNWTATYDALGRRLQTVTVPVSNSIPLSSQSTTINQFYDPLVEFQEVAVSINGARAWKIQGPDLDGRYGGMQGVGGLEATIREADGLFTPVVNDGFGNVLATLNPQLSPPLNWSPARVGGYGPVLGYQAPGLTLSSPLAETLVWRSRRMDPSGFYCLGARYYDPLAGRFLSPDPLGHAASLDLYSFCSGDPLNRFDPTGRFGKSTSSPGFGSGGSADDWFPQRQDQLGAGFPVNPQYEALRDELFGQHLTADQLFVGLVNLGLGAAITPINMALSLGSAINTVISGKDDEGEKVSGLGYAWAAANVILTFVPVVGEVGEAVEAGIQGGRELGMVARGLTVGEDTALAADTGALVSRAEEIHSALNPIAQEMRTTAALDTSGGRIIAGGGRDLTPAQRALLGPGETAAKLPGAHAEVTALQHAAENGLTPQAIGVTRAICPECEAAIKASGGTLTSPTTAVWPH